MSSDFRTFATPSGLDLGPVAAIADGRARGFTLPGENGTFHGFIVRKGDEIYGYVDRCPHAGQTLAETPDDYLTPQGDLISCSWHGALFSIASGRSIAGPCAGQSLITWPVSVRDGHIMTL